ncbi:unnamed protein product [Closterium sp. Naga37s-1]|nr:unnamed protein product [Closterium sp. Naga37s-1]CAI5521698.1 unnamed protein product [Closterium sp. Naga37s-1]
MYRPFLKCSPFRPLFPSFSRLRVRSSSPPLLPPPTPDRRQSMYVRAKRRATTYFLYCEPSQKVLQVKQNLEVLCGQAAGDIRLVLLHSNATLDDNRSLAEQRVENDAVVALTYRLSASVTVPCRPTGPPFLQHLPISLPPSLPTPSVCLPMRLLPCLPVCVHADDEWEPVCIDKPDDGAADMDHMG